MIKKYVWAFDFRDSIRYMEVYVTEEDCVSAAKCVRNSFKYLERIKCAYIFEVEPDHLVDDRVNGEYNVDLEKLKINGVETWCIIKNIKRVDI